MQFSEPVSSPHAATSFMDDLPARRLQNRTSKKIVASPYPFLKWAGGKRQLLEQLDQYLPASFETYIEPFVGGGAMFFYLLPERGVLMDINPALINVYQVIKDNVDELIELLHQHKNTSEYYYRIRNLDRDPAFTKLFNVEMASRNIFLNRCCFNGLYRVNSKGEFNVPFGKYKNPKYCDEPNLRAVHELLQNVVLLVGSFERVLEFASPRSFIYFDPPYVPISSTASFTSYTKEDFSAQDQAKLRDIMAELDKRGCQVMLSNSYCEYILELYQDFNIHTVRAKRAINSVGEKRGAIDELLITNF